MDNIWVILTLALVFSVIIGVVSYRIGFIKGYRSGALKVLNEWKKVINEEDE